MYGRFGDQFGSRAALVMAFAAAATSYGLLGLAGSVWVLFLSRLPSMFMHAMQGESLTTALRCIKSLKVITCGFLRTKVSFYFIHIFFKIFLDFILRESL